MTRSMLQRKYQMALALGIVFLVAACTRSLSDPLPVFQPEDPTATTQVAATNTPVTENSSTPTETSNPPTSTQQPDSPTATSTSEPIAPTPSATPPMVTPTRTPIAITGGEMGLIWNLADVRYGVHQDRVRVVIEMADDRASIPHYKIEVVDNT
ncbi:MAG: hypothetical protein P1S60_05235, partial [Anaerolineae bacterium]|nr:hypothetical protein [Anaerolineae bacterium]